MLRYFHVSFAHCSLYLFRSSFNFVPSVIVYFSYLISCRITQYHQLRRIGPSYLLLFIFRVYKRSRLLIEGFYFCGLTEASTRNFCFCLRGLLIDGSVLFLRVNRRTPVCLFGFYFSRIAQTACLFSLLSPWVTNRSRWFLNFSSLYALLFFCNFLYSPSSNLLLHLRDLSPHW